ncbi:MAG: Hsp70 family protein [Parachlamydiaceae bacterium]|nr:Hsp70 family protein [Parachlamydiaceae bacterium]
MTRYLIGIDLGTTNSAVSYVDTSKKPLSIQLFSIPQFVSSGRVDSLFTLPSFCYLVSKEEWPPGSLRLPWKEETNTFVGQFAKNHGSRVPTRLVQSAKSWLCNVAANRMDRILPIDAADIASRLSPVEATAKYLLHLKDAWNTTFAKGDVSSEFEEQDIILTVPASFDEVARTLTVQAARLAGLNHLTLLEEPQAAFYSWIAQHEDNWQKQLKPNESILVCDVGGGTTDFSLIEVQEKDGSLTFQRMAVGDHLLLGGDNMDAMLAHYLEQRLVNEGHPPLDSTQWHQLRAEARSAKESLLEPTKVQSDNYTIVLQGSGSSVIKSSMTLTVERAEIEKLLLDGFFGVYDLENALKLNKSRGFRTLGLPYEDDPSITKQMAHFLAQAQYLAKGVDYILFNGGTLKPEPFQKAIIQSLTSWFPFKKVSALTSTSLDLAVARGAAYYGKVRRGFGVTIGGGIPRTYYLEIGVKDKSETITYKALTLLSRGAEEGATFEPDQIYLLTPNTPVSFNLLNSHVRLDDKQGDLVAIDELEMQRLPPIHTILRFGRKLTTQELQEKIPVRLGMRLTAIGTVEIWLHSVKTEHKWNLEFQLRTEGGQDSNLSTPTQRKDETFDTEYLKEAQSLIDDLFKGSSSIAVSSSIEKLEERLGMERREWSSSVLRGLWEPLLKNGSKRKASNELEVRWWNLAGFLLRPGFGYPLDDFRIKELWKIILSELKQVKTQECQIQQWICFRRIAGGLNKGQQMQIASEIVSTLFSSKSGRIEIKNKSELYSYSEKIRALASFERLDIPMKIRLGEAILARILRKEGASCDYWALGRIGARHLAYGSIGQVIPRDVCMKWVEKILQAEGLDQDLTLFVLGQLSRKTEHRELNLTDDLISKVVDKDIQGEIKNIIFDTRPLTQNEQEKIFGDRLPAGLLIES